MLFTPAYLLINLLITFRIVLLGASGPWRGGWAGGNTARSGICLHVVERRAAGCLFVGLLLQQRASVSQGQICSDSFTCCHTGIEVADQTFHLTQSQNTDTWPTSPSSDPITPGAWQGSHRSANFLSHWYDSTPEKSRRKRDSNPGSSALEADALTTRPTRRCGRLMAQASRGVWDVGEAVYQASISVLSDCLVNLYGNEFVYADLPIVSCRGLCRFTHCKVCVDLPIVKSV